MGGWAVGGCGVSIPEVVMENTKFRFHVCPKKPIPYSRSSRTNQMDLNHVSARVFSFS